MLADRLADMSAAVALRKESVDRNDKSKKLRMMKCKSLSARRAWIEIAVVGVLATLVTSLSARRAWIEIVHDSKLEKNIQSRSPQGERG